MVFLCSKESIKETCWGIFCLSKGQHVSWIRWLMEGPSDWSILFLSILAYLTFPSPGFAILLSHHSGSEGPSEAFQLILFLTSFQASELQTPTQPFWYVLSQKRHVRYIVQDRCHVDRSQHNLLHIYKENVSLLQKFSMFLLSVFQVLAICLSFHNPTTCATDA